MRVALVEKAADEDVLHFVRDMCLDRLNCFLTQSSTIGEIVFSDRGDLKTAVAIRPSVSSHSSHSGSALAKAC